MLYIHTARDISHICYKKINYTALNIATFNYMTDFQGDFKKILSIMFNAQMNL